jgi:hypothetical protein
VQQLPVTHLAEAKRKADPEVIEALESLLERARSGDLLGFVAFCFFAEGCTGTAFAGDRDFSAILVAFEDWKFRAVWMRNRTDEP